MPYTNQDLLTAIQHDDLSTVQTIIAEYQARSSDPTELFAGGTSIHGNALLFALAHARTVHSNSLAIVNALLAVRDHQGQPVLNLNAMSHDPSGNPNEHLTVLFYSLHASVEPQLRHSLLYALLLATGSSGPLNLQLSAGMVSALHQSVYLEDVACFNLLCRVRKPDDSAFFNLNRLLQPGNKTLLDIAYRGCQSRDMLNAIRRAGGKRYVELASEQQRQKSTFKSAAIMPLDMVPAALMAKAAADEIRAIPCQTPSAVMPSITALVLVEEIMEATVYLRTNGLTPV